MQRADIWPADGSGRYPAHLLGDEVGGGEAATFSGDTGTEAPARDPGPVASAWGFLDDAVPEPGGGGDPPEEGSDEGYRPERNWLLIAVAIACVVLGVRATYVGVRVLRDEGVLPAWTMGGF